MMSFNFNISLFNLPDDLSISREVLKSPTVTVSVLLHCRYITDNVCDLADGSICSRKLGTLEFEYI